jgi:hypothetical protein
MRADLTTPAPTVLVVGSGPNGLRLAPARLGELDLSRCGSLEGFIGLLADSDHSRVLAPYERLLLGS